MKKPSSKPAVVGTPSAFIGGEIIGDVAGELIKMGIGKAVEAVAADPSNNLAKKDVPAATVTLANAMANNPVMVNATNNEPWYQSRILVGNTAASVGVVINAGAFMLRAVGIDIDDSSIAQWTQAIAAIITVYGLALSFYGRLKSGLAPLFGWFKR